MIRILLLINILILLLIVKASNGQNLYDLKHSKEFAYHLMNTNQYNSAVKEFERVIHLTSNKNAFAKELLRCYYNSGKFNEGILRAEKMYTNHKNIPESVALEYIRLLLKEDDGREIKKLLAKNQSIGKKNKIRSKLTSFMIEKKWLEAKNYFDSNENHLQKNSNYRELIHDATNQKHKSQALALGLSTLIPGIGKVYTGDWKDGLASFILVSFNGYLAYRGFNQKGINNAQGWLFSGIGFSFYLGNLYGSLKSANNFNLRQNNNVINRSKEIWNQKH